MNFLLCSLGSHGDIHPYLAIGRELNRLGHTASLATSEGYRDLVVGHGLGFTPIRPESRIDDETLMARIMDARHGPETVIRDLLMPAFRDTYQDLVEPAARADLLVSHVLTYAVPVLAEHTGKPWVSTVLSPMVFFSAHDVPVLAPAPFLARLRVLGPGFNAWLFRQLMRVSKSWTRPVAELRRELGLPPGRDPLVAGQHSPHGILALFSRHFGPPQPDWPAGVSLTGFPFLDHPGESLDSRLQEFLDAGEPPLVFSLGSSAVEVGGAVLRPGVSNLPPTPAPGGPGGGPVCGRTRTRPADVPDRRAVDLLLPPVSARGGGHPSWRRGHHGRGVACRRAAAGRAVRP